MKKAEIKQIADYLKDQQVKVLLASLECKARKCKQCIEARAGQVKGLPCDITGLQEKSLLNKYSQLL